MYRSSSPYAPPVEVSRDFQPRPYSPSPGAVIAPNSITYTTSTGPDGRTIYHPFKAVAASYQTPNGVVSGIQWVPAEATQTLPAGAQPANADFAASWNRGHLSRDDASALNEWNRDEAKMKKKEEKEAKRQREQAMGQSRVDHDHELRKARERDAQAGAGRERRKSFNAGAAGAPGGYTFPTPGGGNPGYPVAGSAYPSSPYSGYGDPPGVTSSATGYPSSSPYSRDSKYGYSDLDRQFGDLDIDRDRNRGYGDRERKTSGVGGRPRKYSISDSGERGRTISGNLGTRPEYGSQGPYGPPNGPYNSRSYSSGSGAAQHASPNMRAASPNMRAVSPNMRPGDAYIPNGPSGYPGSHYSSSPARPQNEPPLPRSTTPFTGTGGPVPSVYPRGHVREGQPISHSRAPSPMPSAHGPPSGPYSSGSVSFPQGGPSPRMPGPITFPSEPVAQLAAPEGFSRSVNGNFPFTPFDVIKVQDMEHFWEEVPRMPGPLMDHDVLDRDWDRLMQDMALAWAGKLPVPENGAPKKRSDLIKDLVDLWNASFFFVRGIELVLYRGKERRSGPHAGAMERDLPYHDDPRDCPSSTSEEESEDSEGSDYAGGRDPYGRSAHGRHGLNDVFEAGRRRREIKSAARAEKKKRRHERNRRRREKYREKKYSLYLTSVPLGVTQGGSSGMPGGFTGSSGGGYGRGY
ncbi:hypothetical protein BDZ94DRAFT_549085 [Collybia nuda]|uniref:Uncharacterized protein n=1 Tax=Collybia nuda TaxID=64659 RepID=A0A9P5YH52_9AGAR|nr:hypothetical protein BDZ94DRAFT_549085 [Collybia nuda]